MTTTEKWIITQKAKDLNWTQTHIVVALQRCLSKNKLDDWVVFNFFALKSHEICFNDFFDFN